MTKLMTRTRARTMTRARSAVLNTGPHSIQGRSKCAHAGALGCKAAMESCINHKTASKSLTTSHLSIKTRLATAIAEIHMAKIAAMSMMKEKISAKIHPQPLILGVLLRTKTWVALKTMIVTMRPQCLTNTWYPADAHYGLQALRAAPMLRNKLHIL
jgi:hypothetical protein